MAIFPVPFWISSPPFGGLSINHQLTLSNHHLHELNVIHGEVEKHPINQEKEEGVMKAGEEINDELTQVLKLKKSEIIL